MENAFYTSVLIMFIIAILFNIYALDIRRNYAIYWDASNKQDYPSKLILIALCVNLGIIL